MLDIAVLSQPGREEEMDILANSLGLEIVSQPSEADFLIQYDPENRLTIRAITVAGSPLYIELAGLHKAKGKDPLMRAIGYTTRSVFDTTAGWATDAMHIASHQIMVTACERNPVVSALVRDGLKRCQESKIRNQLTLMCGDSGIALNQLTQQPEVVYLDPMYPAKPGTAAVKKELQLLQALYGLTRYAENQPTENAKRLLDIARSVAQRRVVVKRPHYAPPISPNPSGAVSAKLVRFDLYSPL